MNVGCCLSPSVKPVMDGRLDHLHLMKGWDQGGGGKEMIDGSNVSIWLCFPSFS